MGVTRDDVIAEARSWIGTRFSHQACVKQVGCDCAGLVRGVAINLGLFALDFHKTPQAQPFMAYGRMPDARLLGACREFMDQVAWKDIQLGDVMLFAIVGRIPQHVGIATCLEPLTMVHSYSKARVMACVEQPVSFLWRKRAVGAFRYRGLACS